MPGEEAADVDGSHGRRGPLTVGGNADRAEDLGVGGAGCSE
jgi:hypothetical protein